MQSSGAVVPLLPCWDDYLRARDRKSLFKSRSSRQKQAEAGFTVQMVRTPNELADALPTSLDTGTQCWKHIRQSSMAIETGTAAFFWEVSPRLTRTGLLLVYFPRLEGAGVAYALGAVHFSRFYLTNAYGEAFRHRSPILLLVWQSMRNAAEKDCTTSAFLGDVSGWECAFCTTEPRYITCGLFAPFALRCQRYLLRKEVLRPLARRSRTSSLLRCVGTIQE